MLQNRICRVYILDFLKTFFILLISLSFLLSVVGIIDKIEDFIQLKPSLIFFIKYILLIMPRYTFYLIPFITLISALFIFSIGVRTNELLMISVAGAKLRTVLRPFLILGILVSISGFIVGEFIQPESLRKANDMIYELSEKRKTVVRKNVYFRDKDNTLINIGEYNQDKGRGSDIKIYFINDNSLIKRIDSKEAEISDKFWLLRDVTIFDFTSGRIERLDKFNFQVNFKLSLTSFKDIKKIEEFSLQELIKKREELRSVGLSNPKIDTDISGKLSYNFVTFFMIILGISLPLGAYEKFSFLFNLRKGESRSSGILTVSLGLLVTIAYWLVYSFFMFMGYSKILPPLLAPWLTPLLFGLLSVKLYYSIKE